MIIQDRFWRLVFLFWWFSAAALVLGMVSMPLLRSAVENTAAPPMAMVARADSSSVPTTSVHPATVPAVPTLAEHVADAHWRARHTRHSTAASTKIPLGERKRTPSTSHKDSPTAVIAMADVPSPPTNPPAQTAPPVQAETAGPWTTIETSANKLNDSISSAQKRFADETGITVHGLLDFGTNYNFNQPATGNNLYRVFDFYGASSFEPNQAELYLIRSIPNQPGFVIDLNFLNTAEVMHGLTSYYGDQPGAHNPTGWMDPTQVYLTYTIPVGSGINLSAGRQVSLIGFEYIPSWNNINFNQSIDLLYSLGEPFTVTGLRAAYSLNKYIAATLGVNNGWDVIATKNMFQTIEAQLSLTPTENITWNMQGMYGPSTGTQSGSKRALANTTIAWKTPYKPLQLGFEYLFADQSAPVLFSPLTESPAYPNPLLSPQAQPIQHSVWWSGVGVWAAYNPTDALQLATRGEWFGDTSGARSGIAQNLGEITETLSYTVPFFSALTARLEYRHDFSSEHPFPNAGPVVTFVCPAGRCVSTAHTYSGQDTFETALILKF
jgi:putative OmpL-like beta-barrel porin-2